MADHATGICTAPVNTMADDQDVCSADSPRLSSREQNGHCTSGSPRVVAIVCADKTEEAGEGTSASSVGWVKNTEK